MERCIGISLDDAYVLMDVFGSNGWKTFAVPLRFVLAFFDAKRELSLVFSPWARGMIFCARDGFIVCLPTSTGDIMIQLGMAILNSERSAGLFNELSDSCPMDAAEMDVDTLHLLQQGLHNERRQKPEEWWATFEPVTIWNGERISHKDIQSRAAVMLTSSGLMMRPVFQEGNHPPIPPSAMLN